MHQTAMENYELFLKKYITNTGNNLKVLDVGSYDVNGALKPSTIKHIPNCKYLGMDMCEGPNVDVVSSSHNIPFKNEFFDVIISTSCFEHDEMFWVTFKEMVRVLKMGGLIYICAPSSGPYHAHPVDCWRFYKDSWKALEKWCSDVTLLESYIDNRDNWGDSIGIFKKNIK